MIIEQKKEIEDDHCSGSTEGFQDNESNKAPDPGGISKELIKQASKSCNYQIFNKCLKREEVPQMEAGVLNTNVEKLKQKRL